MAYGTGLPAAIDRRTGRPFICPTCRKQSVVRTQDGGLGCANEECVWGWTPPIGRKRRTTHPFTCMNCGARIPIGTPPLDCPNCGFIYNYIPD